MRRRAVGVVVALLIGAIAAGCGGSSASVEREELAAALDLEIRDGATARIVRTGERLDVSLELTNGFGLVDATTALAGAGRLERFPEASTLLYTARFETPPVADGPCGAAPVSLALSLVRRAGSPRVAGALAAACGEGAVDTGAPRRLLRLSGRLVEPAP